MTLGGPANKTAVLSYSIYKEAFLNNRWGYASAQSVVFLVILLTISIIQFRIEKKGVILSMKPTSKWGRALMTLLKLGMIFLVLCPIVYAVDVSFMTNARNLPPSAHADSLVLFAGQLPAGAENGAALPLSAQQPDYGHQRHGGADLSGQHGGVLLLAF